MLKPVHQDNKFVCLCLPASLWISRDHPLTPLAKQVMIWITAVISHPITSKDRWLVKAPEWIHSVRAGGRDVAVAMRDCGISTTPQTCPVCKHRFSAFPIDKTSSVKAQIGLLLRWFCIYLSTGCGINAKVPSGLDSDRWIPLRDDARIPRWLWIMPPSIVPFLCYRDIIACVFISWALSVKTVGSKKRLQPLL